MTIIKLGEAFTITSSDIHDSESILLDQNILDNFKKYASELKAIAPKAKDFLYFSAIMMHAAEASILNDDGTVKVGNDGNPIKCGWDTSNGTWRWWCSDPNIMPYKNANADIFPEQELIKAHKKWVGKPLCLDHKSDSVDHVRGIIVDTYYDRKNKRVIALCALDAKGYPQLARQVKTGYSTSVSMGTAVGRAICTTCAKVARVESEFCDHMRNKSCYGEINVDLNPIELSIVVNGADPKAKIKSIVASANSLSQYIESKRKHFEKIANTNKVSANDLDDIRSDIDKLNEKLYQLENAVKSQNEDTNDAESMSYWHNDPSSPSDEVPTTMDENKDDKTYMESIEPIENQVIASENTLKELRASMKKIEENLYSLSKNLQNNIGNTDMANKKAYYQGGGGVNEPTLGTPKYEKEDAETIRNTQDRHMVGQMDTGPVDGMHPGYESFGESELERKKRLQRAAEANDRAMKRKAALKRAQENLMKNKLSYYQGTEEPTLGKPKYPKEDAETIRNKEDKHMTGQKPFPDVGPVDGLHPSPESVDIKDEKKRKEMLQRASLKAKFIKAANPDGTENYGDSRWQVYAGDKLILTATVNEIAGGNHKVATFYDSIATKDFGLKILDTIKTAGFERASVMFKGAQATPPAPMAAGPGMNPNTNPGPAPAPASGGAMPPDMPPDMPQMDDMNMDPSTQMPEDADEFVDESIAADPATRAKELADNIRDAASDLGEAISSLVKEQPELANVEELDQMNMTNMSGMGQTTASLQSVRKTLNGELVRGMKEVIAKLKNSYDELRILSDLHKKNKVAKASTQKEASDRKLINDLTKETFVDANKVLADSKKLLSAFVKYTSATNTVKNRIKKEALAAKKARMAKLAQHQHVEFPEADVIKGNRPTDENDANDDINDISSIENENSDHVEFPEDVIKVDQPIHDQVAPFIDPLDDITPLDNDVNDVQVELSDEQMKKLLENTKTASDKPDITTKEGRAAFRAKLAQKGVQYSKILNDAHPKGGPTLSLDIKPEGDLAKIETLEETQKRMLEIANATPKIKRDAAKIQKLISEGTLQESQLDELVANGVDQAAVNYWRQLYKDVDGGSEFAAELVKEHAKAKVDNEIQAFKVKYARAYDLANEMLSKGMVSQSGFKAQVDAIMKFNDEAFENTKRMVAKLPAVGVAGIPKQASIPVIGTINDGSSAPALTAEASNLHSELEMAFAGRRY